MERKKPYICRLTKTFSDMRTNFTFKTLAIAAAMALATSCGSKKDNPAPDPGTEKPEPEEEKLPAPTTAGFTKLREDALKDMTGSSKHTVSLGGIAFETKKKVSGHIESVALKKKDGTEVVPGSEVEFSVAEIYDRGAMVVANMPLMGHNADGKLEPLATGGLLFLGAKQGAEELSYAVSSHFNIMGLMASFTGGDPGNNTANLWRGVTDAGSGNLTWTTTPPDGASRVGEAMLMGTEEYHIEANVIGWLNVGWLYPHQGAKTKLKVNVPDGYNAQNANVYLAYEGEKHLLAQLYDYDAAGKHFSEPVGFVPVGKKVHAIFVSESEGKFVLGIKTVTVAANAEVTFAHKDLETIDADKLAEKVNKLD